MKDILKLKKGITHNGIFHMDDVISTAFLKSLNPNLIIERCAEYVGEGNDETIVYDIGFGKYDHHQEDCKISHAGIPMCAFGLLFEDFGRSYLEQKGFKRIEKAFYAFRDGIVHTMNYGDNFGFKHIKTLKEHDMISLLNPKWFEIEQQGDEIFDVQFEKAVELGIQILELWMRELFSKIEYEKEENEIWQKAMAGIDKGVVWIEKNIPTYKFIKESNDVKFIVSKDNRSNGYKIYSPNPTQYKLEPCDGLSFIHRTGFLGISDDLQTALKVAKQFS